jgi:hypothetical protein
MPGRPIAAKNVASAFGEDLDVEPKSGNGVEIEKVFIRVYFFQN